MVSYGKKKSKRKSKPLSSKTSFGSILFSDIKGSSMLWKTHPEQMESALMKHNSRLDKAIGRNGGEILRTMGDAFMVFCSGKQGYKKAFKVAIAMQKAVYDPPIKVGGKRLKIRVGFCQGPIQMMMTRYQNLIMKDVMGSTPNIASRMESKVSALGGIAFCFWRVPIPRDFLDKVSKRYDLYVSDFHDPCMYEPSSKVRCLDPEVLHGVPQVTAFHLKLF